MPETLEQVKENADKISDTLTVESNDLVIADHEGLELAALLNAQAKDEIKVIEAAFKPHKDNAYKAHKDLCVAESKQLAPFKEITTILKPKILKYTTDQEAKEKKEKEDREAKQREVEANAKMEAEEKKAAQVETLMDVGDFEKAEEMMEAPTPQPVAAYVPEPEKKKVKGAGTKKVWKARCINFALVDDKLKLFDQKSADKLASALKDKAKEPGIEFYEDTQLTGK